MEPRNYSVVSNVDRRIFILNHTIVYKARLCSEPGVVIIMSHCRRLHRSVHPYTMRLGLDSGRTHEDRHMSKLRCTKAETLARETTQLALSAQFQPQLFGLA